MKHVCGTFGVSEHRVRRVLGQYRSTQRKPPQGGEDEARLTADVIELALEYGRYGYRRVAVLLRRCGWQVKGTRRGEGLKVPHKQEKRGRLWQGDGSCVRLKPEHSNHVCYFNFVQDRTSEGQAYRARNILDEYTPEVLMFRVVRRLNSTDVLDALTDLFIQLGHNLKTALLPDVLRPGVHRAEGPRLDRVDGGKNRLHRAEITLGERLLRELQQQVQARVPEWRSLLLVEIGTNPRRKMAKTLEHGPAA